MARPVSVVESEDPSLSELISAPRNGQVSAFSILDLPDDLLFYLLAENCDFLADLFLWHKVCHKFHSLLTFTTPLATEQFRRVRSLVVPHPISTYDQFMTIAFGAIAHTRLISYFPVDRKPLAPSARHEGRMAVEIELEGEPTDDAEPIVTEEPLDNIVAPTPAVPATNPPVHECSQLSLDDPRVDAALFTSILRGGVHLDSLYLSHLSMANVAELCRWLPTSATRQLALVHPQIGMKGRDLQIASPRLTNFLSAARGMCHVHFCRAGCVGFLGPEGECDRFIQVSSLRGEQGGVVAPGLARQSPSLRPVPAPGRVPRPHHTPGPIASSFSLYAKKHTKQRHPCCAAWIDYFRPTLDCPALVELCVLDVVPDDTTLSSLKKVERLETSPILLQSLERSECQLLACTDLTLTQPGTEMDVGHLVSAVCPVLQHFCNGARDFFGFDDYARAATSLALDLPRLTSLIVAGLLNPRSLQLAACPSLRHLDLGASRRASAALLRAGIYGFALERLVVHGATSQIVDAFDGSRIDVSRLTHLAILHALTPYMTIRCPRLVSLQIYYLDNHRVTKACPPLDLSCPALRTLSLSTCSKLGFSLAQWLLSSLAGGTPGLETAMISSLSASGWVPCSATPPTAHAGMVRAPALRRLVLAGDDHLPLDQCDFPALREFYLRREQAGNDEALAGFLGRCPHLTHLGLHECRGFQALRIPCPRLQVLSAMLPGGFIRVELPPSCPDLRELSAAPVRRCGALGRYAETTQRFCVSTEPIDQLIPVRLEPPADNRPTGPPDEGDDGEDRLWPSTQVDDGLDYVMWDLGACTLTGHWARILDEIGMIEEEGEEESTGSSTVKQINWEEGNRLTMLRAAFIGVQLLQLIIYGLIYMHINSSKDTREIRVPIPKPKRTPGGPTTEASNVQKYDMGQLMGLFNSAIMGMGFTLFLHFKFGFIPPLVLGIVMSPLQIWGQKLFQLHILRKAEVPGQTTRPFPVPPNMLSMLMGGGQEEAPRPAAPAAPAADAHPRSD
ncbi:putative Phosphate transport (Pho88) [Paratrimastix pyriformis]|uniref:Phosphate transport (Pho88) n=1 Tax=Paratrimastix pyriformis TaxID=342808 RepID=A0ABQ8UEA4_9EUKA|nr:putative Phosphate transport (Pho88) [Paratrimastix pyriformis]